PALRWHDALAAAAQRHAQDLAARGRLDHLGAEGASLRTRLRAAGYALRQAGENLAGGPETLDEALAQWLASPVHCENLMEPQFQELGLACVTGAGPLQRYWVLQLAAPARARP
ncbi:MAG: CAP domain-containing protein, partial [Roseateles sp.]